MQARFRTHTQYTGKRNEAQMPYQIEQIAANAANFLSGRQGHKPTAIVSHVMQGTMQGTIEWFQDPASQASAHFGVGLEGRIVQFVATTDTAYSNGNVRRPNVAAVPWLADYPAHAYGPNLDTISIEHEGHHVGGYAGRVLYNGAWLDVNPLTTSVKTWWTPTPAQYQASLWLQKQLIAEYEIPIDRAHIIRHSDLDSVTRMFCPGTGFPLARLLGDLGDPEFAAQKSQPQAPFVPAIFGPASINLATFTSILAQYKSPITAERPAADYYKLLADAGIDPNFALAMWAHESQIGVSGTGAITKNLGNLRPTKAGDIGRAVDKKFTPYGVFRRYDSWYSGACDWADLMSSVYRGMSIADAIALYAPAGDGSNKPSAYTNAVQQAMYAWQQTSAGAQ